MRISIPIKVLCLGGVVYLLTLGLVAALTELRWIDPAAFWFFFPVRYYLWLGQLLVVTLSMVLASHILLDRRLRRLKEVMIKAKEGDFLVRAKTKGDDVVAE